MLIVSKMQTSLFLFSFLLSQVASHKFHLTYKRIGKLGGSRNNLIFICKATGNYSSSQNFSYWINETEQIDILNGIPYEDAAVRVTEGVAFYMQPQYEGTLYCGEMNGEKSNGVGPLIGRHTQNSEVY